MTEQTQLEIQNTKRSVAKVRRLTPDQLDIPTGPNDDEAEDGAWEVLRSRAIEAIDDSGDAAAVRAEDGTIATGTSLSKGASHDVHAVELAVWKVYDASGSPIVDVAVASDMMDVPCGRCLQVLSDYAQDGNATIQITDEDDVKVYSLADLIQ